MTVAVSLQAAAGLAFDNLQVKWLGNQLPSSILLFCPNVKLIFHEQEANSHPCINWNTILWNLGAQMVNPPPIAQLGLAAEYVFRMCWMTNQLQVQGLITAPQAAAVLLRYNQFLSVP